MFREYRTAHGRWTSPDRAGLGAVDRSSPQGWNRYGYVGNNPLVFVDPLGLFINCPPPQPGEVQVVGPTVNKDGTTNCPVYGRPCPMSQGWSVNQVGGQTYFVCGPPSDIQTIP